MNASFEWERVLYQNSFVLFLQQSSRKSNHSTACFGELNELTNSYDKRWILCSSDTKNGYLFNGFINTSRFSWLSRQIHSFPGSPLMLTFSN